MYAYTLFCPPSTTPTRRLDAALPDLGSAGENHGRPSAAAPMVAGAVKLRFEKNLCLKLEEEGSLSRIGECGEHTAVLRISLCHVS